MALQNSQKYVYSSVTTTADRAEETAAEKAHTQSKASCYCNCIASAPELLMERLLSIVYTALQFLVLILVCSLYSPFHKALNATAQPLCTASCSAPPLLLPRRARFPDRNRFEQQPAAEQTWAQCAGLCLQIHSAPLNHEQLLDLNQNHTFTKSSYVESNYK